MSGAPRNLEALAVRALAVAGGALALAARSASAEEGSAEAVRGAVDAAAVLARNTAALIESASLAASASAAAAATTDLEMARDQLAGAAAVLAAERAWSSPLWQPGLLGTYWRGLEPGSGTPAFQAGDTPAFTNREPRGLGHGDWSARWEGEILLPEAGRWIFRCTADDGVRLRVAGQEVLPAGSWQHQASTAYVGTLDLPAGWQPIAIDYFQGGGDNHLLVEAGRGEPSALGPERLRHRLQPDARAREAMTALPAGAAEAAALRARRSGEDALAAAATLARAVRGRADLEAAGTRITTTLAVLTGVLDWTAGRPVDDAAEAVGTAVAQAAELAHQLAEACRKDARGMGGSGFAERLRTASDHPGSKAARLLAGDLARERAVHAALAADNLPDPAQRAAALAAAWAIDSVITALEAKDADAARAAVAAAIPALALASRHARAAEAADGAAKQKSALLAELALSPGWPPGLLRAARDLLRQAATALRASGDLEQAVQLAAEVARAAELEALRPGVPPSDALTTAATWLRDLAVLPQADALAEIADLLEHVDRAGAQTRPQSRALAAASAARRSAASAALVESAVALAAAAPALHAAGQTDLAERASALAALARALAASPDRTTALGLSEALAKTLAAPLAEALASGRLEPGGTSAQAGRIAARASAAAAAIAAITAPAATPPEDEEATWNRSHDRTASEAASAATAVDFPEEQRAAIRAYLRRIGAPR